MQSEWDPRKTAANFTGQRHSQETRAPVGPLGLGGSLDALACGIAGDEWSTWTEGTCEKRNCDSRQASHGHA